MKRGKKVRKKNTIASPKKSYNSDAKLIITIVLTILTLIILFILFKNLSPTTKVIEKPYSPENCSNESIIKVWESVFNGSSEDLIIIAPNESLLNEMESSEYSEGLSFGRDYIKINDCPIYAVYQINGSNVRSISGMNNFLGINMVAAISGDYPPEFVEYVRNLSGRQIENEMSFSSDTSDIFLFLNRNVSISNLEEAKYKFGSVFSVNISYANWTPEEYSLMDEFENGTEKFTDEIRYIFYETEEGENITLFGEKLNPETIFVSTGGVEGNLSYEYYTYAETSLAKQIKILEREFENWTSPINTSLKNITIEINNSRLSVSEELSIFSEPRSEFQKVEILQNNQTIIETEINFTLNTKFDWTKIIIKKQEENSSRGYIIINGLNFTKNITLDRINNKSESVCVKDKEVQSINEISEECNLYDEYLLECPGNLTSNTTNLICKKIPNKFIIIGLQHSAVIEMTPPEEPCIPNWTCEEWSDYEDQCGYRICTDLNNCMNESTRPLEYKTCPICIPDWDCTEFLPEKCPKSEKRTRTCTDKNNCGKEENIPDTTQTCERKSSLIWIILGILFGISALIALILIISKNKSNIKDEEQKEHPKIQNGIHKEHPNHPSKREQNNASNQTQAFKTQKNPYNPINNIKDKNDDYYYPEGYQ